MKKTLKKFLVTLLAATMVFSSLTFTAAADEAEGYTMFIAYGGDAAESGDWGYGYAGPESDNAGDIEAVVETINVGETKTVSLTLPSECVYTWYMAPVILAEGVTDLDATITVAIDGNDVTGDVDFAAGDAWWYEGTGNYDETQAIRLAGGYNEWGTQYMSSPVFTTIEYTVTLNSLTTDGASAEGGDYPLFIAFGGDAAESGDWGYGYAGPDSDNAGDIEAVVETINVGETKTVSLTLPSECVYTWYLAPVLLAEGVTDLDATISVAIDGNDVTGDVDFAAGDAWWYEGTGNYADTMAIRLAGGYNEWGTQYMSSPVFTTIEYTVTLNSISTGAGEAAGDAVESTEEYEVFLAIGADAAESGDWVYVYYGPDCANNAGDVVATNATITSGGTATVALEFPSPVVYTWFVAPVICATDITAADFSVQVLIDGTDVTDTIDMAAGDNWWVEDTGDYSNANGNAPIRVAGGFNEWGTRYMAESPVGFSKIEFVITANSIMVGGAAEAPVEEETSAAGAVDLDGTYNAYIGFQTPKFSFRNAFDDATYGRDTSDVFNQVTGWDSSNNAVVLPGTFTDVEIAGNGTYTVSVEGLEFPAGEFDSQEFMNLIFLSTDIPNTGEITISDVELKVDGKGVDLASAGAIVSPDSVNYLNILIQNIWNEDVSEIGYYNVPMTSMSITFTVSGFNYDKAVEEAPVEETPADTEAPAADAETSADADEESGSNTGLIVGIVAGVVAVAGVGAGVVVSKKKKAK